MFKSSEVCVQTLDYVGGEKRNEIAFGNKMEGDGSDDDSITGIAFG